MIKLFNNLEEIEKYYIKETNTYVFKEDGKWIDLVIFNFNLRIGSNIKANNINARHICVSDIDVYDINARDIKARDINACNINACNINANNIDARDINAGEINATNINAKNINYWAVCFAYENIVCTSIRGRRENSKHFVLDGKLEVKNENS